MDSSTGKNLMIIGGGIFIVGTMIYFFGGGLKWLGHLPGDIRI
jgi:hypothetical protein